MQDAQLIDSCFDEICTKGKEVTARKGADYANTSNRFINFEKLAHMNSLTTEQAFCFYLGIKLARLTELFGAQKTPRNESVEDTIEDMINYAVLFYAFLRKQQHAENV